MGEADFAATVEPTGLERWDREIGEEVSAEAIAQMRSHPRFQEALRLSIARALALVDENPVLHANFRDMGRMVLGTFALYLDATGGLTHRRLRDLSGDAGTLSTGRASALLLQLRLIGYVTPAQRRSDGSARLYVPTKAMKDAFRARLRIELESLMLVEPAVAPFLACLDDDKVLGLYFRFVGENLVRGSRLADSGAVPFNALTMRDAGMLLIYALLQAADTGGEFPPSGPVQFSVAALARQFGVSRRHIRRLLDEAEATGLFTRTEAGGVIPPALADSFGNFCAILYILSAAMVHRALVALSQDESRDVLAGRAARSDAAVHIGSQPV